MASSLSISMTQENTTHLQIGRGMGLVQEGGGRGWNLLCFLSYSGSTSVLICMFLLSESLRCLDSDNNKDVKKKYVLIRKTTTLHVHTFLVHFFAVTARLQCEIALISCSVENINKG